MITRVLFIHSDQPAIDRGWDTTDARMVLSQSGFQIEDFAAREDEEVRSFIAKRLGEVVVWPVCYTVGPDVDGSLLVDILADLRAPYIGPTPRAIRLNSKLHLKEALADSAFRTPDYRVIDAQSTGSVPFAVPYVVKTEYSCDSQGVSIIRDASESAGICSRFIADYGQRVFAEKWERRREYTAACVPSDGKVAVAPIEMHTLDDNTIVDRKAKSDNDLLRFSLPDEPTRATLVDYASSFASTFAIGGPFRVDVLQNDHDELHIIDVNFLPQMHSDPDTLSYFPMCYQMNYGMTFGQVVGLMISSAHHVDQEFQQYALTACRGVC